MLPGPDARPLWLIHTALIGYYPFFTACTPIFCLWAPLGKCDQHCSVGCLSPRPAASIAGRVPRTVFCLAFGHREVNGRQFLNFSALLLSRRMERWWMVFGAVSARLELISFIFSTVSSVHASASTSSDENAFTAWAIYILALPLRASSCCLGLLHDVLVGDLQLFYFLSDCLQGLRNLIYDWIQIIYYYPHFWHYFHLRFLH